jgi:Cytochrome P460
LTVDSIPSSGRKEKQHPDLISLTSSFGKKVRSIFQRDNKMKPAPLRKAVTTAPQGVEPVHNSSLSMGVVYANDKARSNIYYNSPSFPVGSMIVREKHDDELNVLPNTVIAMVKRDPGFSPQTGDWEFFMFDGRTLALKLRETVGNCATCHTHAKSTDWSFRTYMNFTQ